MLLVTFSNLFRIAFLKNTIKPLLLDRMHIKKQSPGGVR